MRKLLLTFTLLALARAENIPPPTGPSAELLANETRRRVSDDIKRALEDKCPQQCDVGEVTVKVSRRKPVVGSTPGFEELTPDVKEFYVEHVDADLVLDKKLTNDFRSGLKTLLSKKLLAQGIANDLHENLIHYPQPPADVDRPPPQLAPLIIKNESDRREPAPQLVLPPGPSAWDRFVENLPLLLGLILCGGVVWFTLKQYQRVLDSRLSAKLVEEEQTRKQEDPASLKRAEEARELVRRLESVKSRVQHRPLAQAVAKDLLESGAVADTALAVTLLGPSLFDGVRRDPECKKGLTELDEYLAERAPQDTPEDRRRIIGDLERRLLRMQLRHGEQPIEPAFAFLRDTKAELFVRLLSTEPPDIQALILRHAPPPLVQAFVGRRSAEERERLVRPLLSSTTVSRESAEEVARAFSDKLAAHLVAGEEHPDPIGDLLQAAPADERRRILAGLHNDPEAQRAALRSFVADETLHALDGDVLAAAVSRLDTNTAALFAGSLDLDARGRLYAALPKVTARAIAEEVEAMVASPALRAGAWRSALKAIRGAVEERGLDLAEMNRKGLKSGVVS